MFSKEFHSFVTFLKVLRSVRPHKIVVVLNLTVTVQLCNCDVKISRATRQLTALLSPPKMIRKFDTQRAN